jgi:hypothetical protein
MKYIANLIAWGDQAFRQDTLESIHEATQLYVMAAEILGSRQEVPPDPPSNTMLYFCVPENDRLVAYWDTVADRLFKIRHCMNIEGQVRQLPLFAPPIDPALLVRAQAVGLSIGDVLGDHSIAAR